MSTKKQLNIIVNNKQRNWIFYILYLFLYLKPCRVETAKQNVYPYIIPDINTNPL